MKNYERQFLELELNDGLKLYYNKCQLKQLSEELTSFLEEPNYKVNVSRITSTLFSQGIKFNNSIEGYNDSLEIINQIIKSEHDHNIKKEQIDRILNLYKGYKFILNKKDIDKDSIRKLYAILSKDLIDKEDLELMGDYYRKQDVYIYYSNDVGKKPDKGVDSKLIDEKINNLIAFIDNQLFVDNEVEIFIKSQIAHFYFAYVHPYYDINGRTARTIAMWHLVNSNANHYLLFNRGINLNKANYYRIIRDVVKFANISYFLNFMLEVVKLELEKEKIITYIEEYHVKNFTESEFQSVYNILSFEACTNLLEFTKVYNRFNQKKKPLEIYNEMIIPLIEQKILKVVRNTNKTILDDFRNIEFAFNCENEFKLTKKYGK